MSRKSVIKYLVSCISKLFHFWANYSNYFWSPNLKKFYGKVYGYSTYRISSVIRRSFFSFQNSPKDLDPSCKTDLDFWDCLGRVKIGIIAKFHRTDLVI